MKKIIRNILISVLSLAIVVAVAVPVGFTIAGKGEKKRVHQIEYAFAADTGAASADKSKKGGAIFVEEGGNYTMSGGTISGKKNTYGGAVFISKNATFTMTGGTIKNCSAKYGGAIYVSSGATCYINGGSIINNTAEVAPAIYVEGNGRVVQSNSPEIKDNNVALYLGEAVLGDISGTTKLKTIEFGTYPRDHVSDSMNATLESWYSSSHPSSLKTHNITGYDETRTWNWYQYTDGGIYARGTARPCSSASPQYHDGRPITKGEVAWFKVEPITWFILNYDAWISGNDDIELFSELLMTGDVNYGGSYFWENSTARTWCNGEFYNAAFNSSEKARIKESKIGNNVQGNYDNETSDQSGTPTTDRIYFRSYYEMSISPFTSNNLRVAFGSDFAFANYLYCYGGSRSNEYYLRTKADQGNGYCAVNSDGSLFLPYGVPYYAFGIRPALRLNIKPI